VGKIEGARQSITIAIASVFACLINRQFNFQSKEEEFVLDALRRSKSSLEDAPIEVLGDYVREMDATQMRGLANNVKGIYHELLYVEKFNANDIGLTAELFPNTNHPGADIRIKDGDEIVRQVQLKATDNTDLIKIHIERYPKIPVEATEEAAEKMDGVGDSGFKDIDLEQEISQVFDDLKDDGVFGRADDVVVVSSILAGAKEAIAVLRGQKNINDASGQAIQDVGVAASTSILVDLLFNI